MSDLDSLFDSTKGQFNTRLFTPTKITIKETDSFETLVNELERIHIIYNKDFDICCNELKNSKLDDLVNELYLLRNEQSISLKHAYNISKCPKDLNLKKNINETIQKMEVLYTKMVVNQYLPF